MPFVRIKLNKIENVSWKDKSTGVEKSMMMLEGKIEASQSFIISEDLMPMYKPFLGHEVLLPYTERGSYKNLDPDIQPILLENIIDAAAA